uniref:Monodehydroascorbate reductase n=1 Tax=Tanacetum cinerariifolium TaxID=118510 RepID=A0A6L2M755_TANCI|nr:hypothetical protein [Tanacetum cinerariifolium]GEW26182.1 hypothetical protein [Tanacetum cinerariifolium]
MADVNVNTHVDQEPTMAPPTRTGDQILPHITWVSIGKSNCYLDVERSQSNPIYKIAVDILKHTNFFRASTASSTIPSIYILQFWDSVRYGKTARYYKCQLDEQWFDLTKDTLRDALQITPVNNNNAFSSPPTPDALINFVNDLGYLKFVRNLSDVVTNGMFQPWRALITIINLCLTRKTSGFERPRAPVMPIPDKLITTDSQGEPYYKEYLEKVAKHQRYLVGEKGSDPGSLAPKPAKATKKSKPSAPKADLRPPVTKPASSQQPEPKPKPAKSQGKKRKLVTETSDKPSPARISKPGLVTKRRKPTSSLRSVDEFVDEGILEKEPRFDDEEANTPKKKSPTDQFMFQRRTSTPTESSGHDESSSLYVELGLTNSKVESDKDVPGIDAGVQDEGQAGPNPGDQDEGQAGTNPDEQDEGQARPNPGVAAASQP